MGTLFLASVGGQVLDKIVPKLTKKPKELTVAFIPTAADPYKDKWFVREDRDNLIKAGFNVFNLDLKEKTEKLVRQELEKADIVFVAGGNVFYLLEKSNESGFTKVIKDFVGQGKNYIGSSAGAVIAGQDIIPAEFIDDSKIVPNLKSTIGFGLSPVIVLPHYGKEKYLSKYQQTIEKWKDKFVLIPITDQQLVLVKNNKWDLL